MNFILDMESLQSGQGWVLVFPRGKHYINKYSMVLNFDDKFFNSVEKWWKGSTFIKPYLDKNHEMGEKYGDFTEYRITDKGMEMLLVLNDAGKEVVKSGKFEYLSPYFGKMKDSTGTEYDNVVMSVSLVNQPALMVLKKLKDQISLSLDGDDNSTKGGSPMDELRKLIAGKLKLSLAADDSSILAEIEALINSGITIEQLQAKIAEMKAAMDEQEMALKKAVEEKEVACKALAAIEKKTLESKAVTVIDEAIKLGQFHPSLKELKVAQYLSDKDSVMKELSVVPKKEASKQITTSIGGIELSAEDRDILLSAGYDLEKPEDVKLAQVFLSSQKGGK